MGRPGYNVPLPIIPETCWNAARALELGWLGLESNKVKSIISLRPLEAVKQQVRNVHEQATLNLVKKSRFSDKDYWAFNGPNLIVKIYSEDE